ncbi:hypothetical protein R75461_07234 [Paraburkholderia nemoris]|uniref:hypothetical protein n=1 Tax=Paraburkholderia nemoris TaxID=2793076 RepID=UPI001B11F64D|nr:hypothetical protein [Paraburkholderia nemoris]CAE6845540.1 hypothetical protein R75461_07234 [Paraburkholderia nemoris]
MIDGVEWVAFIPGAIVTAPPRTQPPTMPNECWSCEYLRDVPGDRPIACANPDPAMTGNEHGIRQGWFWYPLLFDPIWKTKDCANYSECNPGGIVKNAENRGQRPSVLARPDAPPPSWNPHTFMTCPDKRFL